jgi:hypothetical protein
MARHGGAALKRLSQENYEFQANLGYTVRPYLKILRMGFSARVLPYHAEGPGSQARHTYTPHPEKTTTKNRRDSKVHKQTKVYMITHNSLND